MFALEEEELEQSWIPLKNKFLYLDHAEFDGVLPYQ